MARMRIPLMASPRSRLAQLAVALIIAVAPTRLPAQAPEERAELELFRDSLAATPDSTGLLVLERRLIDLAQADRNNTLTHLKLGFLSLRVGDLGGQAHYDDAASEFQWAIDLQPTWPYAWYGMGLAEYGVGDSQVSFVTGLKTMLGKDALTRSAMAFAKSAEVDPSFVRGLVELSNTALRQRVNIKLGVALDALRRAASTPAAQDPQVLLARGRVEREVGDGDSALAAFRGDLATIATDSILKEFDNAAGAKRAAYLKQFWTERDRTELRSDGERLREHYRRMFYARKNFQLTSLNRHYDIVERYRSGSRDFDDRGVIYIRHGEPSSRATYAAPGLEPNESWRYTRPEGDLLFHFVAREDVQDFKLVESLFDVLGFSQQIALREDKAANNPVAEQLIFSREQLSPIYQRLQSAGRIGSGQFQAEERRMGQSSIALGTRTDSYELHFAEDLKARTEVLAVGRDSSGTLVQIVYAISGKGLEPVTVTRGFLYSVRVRFTAMDRTGRVVASLDTTRHFVAPEPVPDDEHLVGRVAVAVPTGRFEYRLALQQGEEAGVVLPRDTVRVGGPTSVTLGLSDLVLGSRSTNLAWRRSEQDTVLFNPLQTFKRAEEIQLYYEVQGLQPGSSYEVRLAVRKQGGSGGLFRKIFGGGGAAISLKFDAQATAMVESAHRGLQLEKLKPGMYVLEVMVTDAGGHRDLRLRPFQVVEE